MRQFLAVAILFFTTQCIMGQDTKLGVKGGVNFSNLKLKLGSDSRSGNGNVSIYLGVLVDFEISENFHFQPEALYSIEGADASITFLQIPLMGKLYLNDEFSLLAGPQFGLVLDAEGGTAFLKSTNLALNVGAAYQLNSGFFFDARYNLGISNIIINPVVGEKILTRGFQLGVGYIF